MNPDKRVALEVEVEKFLMQEGRTLTTKHSSNSCECVCEWVCMFVVFPTKFGLMPSLALVVVKSAYAKCCCETALLQPAACYRENTVHRVNDQWSSTITAIMEDTQYQEWCDSPLIVSIPLTMCSMFGVSLTFGSGVIVCQK